MIYPSPNLRYICLEQDHVHRLCVKNRGGWCREGNLGIAHRGIGTAKMSKQHLEDFLPGHCRHEGSLRLCETCLLLLFLPFFSCILASPSLFLLPLAASHLPCSAFSKPDPLLCACQGPCILASMGDETETSAAAQCVFRWASFSSAHPLIVCFCCLFSSP